MFSNLSVGEFMNASTIIQDSDAVHFGTELIKNNCTQDEYILEMIKQFNPMAEPSTIRKIFEWTKYPDRLQITVKDLMSLELLQIQYLKSHNAKDFDDLFVLRYPKNEANPSALSRLPQVINYDSPISFSGFKYHDHNYDQFNSNPYYISWNDLVSFIKRGANSCQYNIYECNLYLHHTKVFPYLVQFGAMLIRIWNEVSPSITTKFELKLEQAKAELRIEMDELKRANIDLKNQIKILEYQLKRLSPDMPMYDYTQKSAIALSNFIQNFVAYVS